MKVRFWLSFDLGLDGDYENLFHWLDLHDANECGDNVAIVTYEYDEDLIEEVKNDLAQVVTLRPRDRLYAVARVDGDTVGAFLYGARKAPPWAGAAAKEAQETYDTTAPEIG